MVNRNVLYQLIVVAIISCIAYLVISATQTNLAELGVDSSFDFLWKRAGFEIGQTLIPFNANSTIACAFLVALINTLLLAFVSIVLASILGLIIGVARLSRNWLTARLATAYVETFRNIPSLLQIFFWYYVVLRSLPRTEESFSFGNAFFLNNRGLFMPAPVLGDSLPVVIAALLLAIIAIVLLQKWAKGRLFTMGSRFPVTSTSVILIIAAPLIAMLVGGGSWEIPVTGHFGYQRGFVVMPEFMALVIGLSMYNATYVAEIVRSGFSSVPHGQFEAASSLGLTRLLTLRLILFPQALRAMIPPLTTLYLNIFKSTSLAAAIAYPEVVSVFVGTVNNLVGQPVIIMAITALTYALISLCIALVLNWYNRRIAVSAQ